jgi:DNA polymerase-3 subunit delta'
MAVSNIAGNSTAKRVLLHTASEGKHGTAFIFSGEENSGKNFAALQFAKVLNCLSPKADGDCCDACDNCRLLDKTLGMLDEQGGQQYPHPDIKYVNTEKSQISKELVREAVSEINAFRGVQLKKKILIINDAERMNAPAANSILKIVEEPNQNVVFMLVVNNTEEMLPTIISRCRRIDMHRASPADMRMALQAARPDWDAGQIGEAVEFSSGRIGDALRYKEIKDEMRDAASIFMAVSGRQDNVEAVFEAVKHVEELYKREKEREKKAKKTGIARIFLLDIIRILSYIYRDYMLEKTGIKTALRPRYGISLSDVRNYAPGKIISILRLLERSGADVEANANVGVVFSNLLFQIRKEGLNI